MATLLLLPSAAGAQVKTFDDLYNTYSKKAGIESKTVGRLMLATARLASKEIPEGLVSVKVLAVKEPSKPATGVVAALERDFRAVAAGCTLLTERSEDGSAVKVYGYPIAGNKIRDIIVYGAGAGGALFVMLMGGEFSNNEKFIRELGKKTESGTNEK
ncbi:MAG: DUF4252 domain-containing protein [Rikenellaceae bacterium]|nr:DUF4252 domain-containing protein [Rikenellaceae bacterium]